MSLKTKTVSTMVAIILTGLAANALALSGSGNSFIDCRDNYINKCAPYDASKYNAQTSQAKLDAYDTELTNCTNKATTLCSSNPKNKSAYQEYKHSESLAGMPAIATSTSSNSTKLIA